ncbi:MAG: guanylate kinase [Magnetovibrio sp.]|nr:guanylate kinase [Magnetovibrio sp.]
MMLVLSSPSGAGKTTISRKLLERDDNLKMSISATTRAPRPGEVDGEDYIFMSDEKFADMVNKNEFLEYATVFDNSYGTPFGPVEAALKMGKDVLFDVDRQGTQQLHGRAGDDLVRVFILPPSKDELECRLRWRDQDSEEVIITRMAQASDEMGHYDEYDYIVVNVDREDSVDDVHTILKAERMKKTRRDGLYDFVRGLCK